MPFTPSSSGIASALSGEKPLGYPELAYFQNGEQTSMVLKKVPFKVGRKTENDLVIGDARVSREHAQFIEAGGDYYVVDNQSKHGTYVNGQRIEGRRKLARNDRLEFGVRDGLQSDGIEDEPDAGIPEPDQRARHPHRRLGPREADFLP